MFLRQSVKFWTILWVVSQKQNICNSKAIIFLQNRNHCDVLLSFFKLHSIPFKSYLEPEGVSGLISEYIPHYGGDEMEVQIFPQFSLTYNLVSPRDTFTLSPD